MAAEGVACPSYAVQHCCDAAARDIDRQRLASHCDEATDDERWLTQCCPDPGSDWGETVRDLVGELLMLIFCGALLLVCCRCVTKPYRETRALLRSGAAGAGAANAASQRRDAGVEYAGLVDAAPAAAGPIVVVAGEEYDPNRASHGAAAPVDPAARVTLVATV